MRARAVVGWVCVVVAGTAAAAVPVDLSKYDPQCGVRVEADAGAGKVRASWSGARERFAVTFDFNGGPLVSVIEAGGDDGGMRVLGRDVDVKYVVTTGSRTQPKVGIYKFVFFDKPASRKTERHEAVLKLERVRVESRPGEAAVAVSTISAGPFSGELVFHFYDGSPLVRVEAAMGQDRPDLAYIYDAVLTGPFENVSWEKVEGGMDRVKPGGAMRPAAVRYRTILGEGESGTVAVFPPPHAFFFPRDRTDNFGFAQVGMVDGKAAFGLRQDPAGGGAFVPWFDAPPGRVQRMGMFLLLSRQGAREALEEVKRYTHGDSFKPVDGRVTFTSHWHSRLTVGEEAGKGVAREFAGVMKAMNVNVVHLAEFHGDGHPYEAGDVRLKEMREMFGICRKFSDEKLLLVPGEEGNKYLGQRVAPKGQHPGHWMYLFPREVYLRWVHPEGRPIAEEVPPYGKVYNVGSEGEMIELLEKEHGLAWTTHPRIKASYMTPDAFKDEPFYRSGVWLGAAWKAMPADLSNDRLGVRGLDLLDDMSNWAVGAPVEQKKYMPGEVDVFEIDHTHELYGHMNVNYLRMAKVPAYEDWSGVLEVLRRGDFFVSTGEVLIHSFDLDAAAGKVRAEVEWTFPPAFAEIVWGDGAAAHHRRVELAGRKEFGRERFEWPVETKAAKWVRLEVWDVAGDGAFTQPAWVDVGR